MPDDRTQDHAFDDYLTRHYSRLGDQERHRAGRKRQLLRTYGRLLPADREARILEIGPGHGQFLELLRQDLGYRNAVAVDVSREVVEFCNGRMPGSASLVTDTAAQVRAQAGTLDAVIAFHVLEHLPGGEPLAMVQAIAAALKPGGRLLVEVPNMANPLTGGYLRYADLTHVGGFAESSLRHLLEAGGLADVACFEEATGGTGLKDLLARTFRALARFKLHLVYRGYELPPPAVLSPALCATAVRPRSAGA
jgi:SAM-dependent methyltransferase